ncbi:MAG TPA: TVP38/TMEM64 family protein [Planctomycetaceae bacterium]|nr:TVP38/TMEM64 family protein [Planctomycetaceae bacterium]
MTSPKPEPPRRLSLVRLGLLLLFLAAVGAGFWWFRDALTLAELADRQDEIVAWRDEHRVLAPLAMAALYVFVALLSLPAAGVLTMAAGWLFGFWEAVILVSFASTAGATLAFLLSRYLFRDWVARRFGNRLQSFDEAWRRDGAFYLFSLRLIPAVPFFAVNLLMGLTTIRTRTFWWVSQLGMLPATCAYVYAGSQVPSLRELAERGAAGLIKPGLLIAIALLGLLPVVLRGAQRWYRRQRGLR